MVESLKKVNNPLTIIAIFAALAEISATIAIKFIMPALQPVFIWFVIGFPTLLVLLFFLTLNFNPRVMYAPTDFRDEGNFLITLRGNSLDVNKRNIAAVQQHMTRQNQTPVTAAVIHQSICFANEFLDHFLFISQQKIENEEISNIRFSCQDIHHFALSVQLTGITCDVAGITYQLSLNPSAAGITGQMTGHNIKSASPKELALLTGRSIEQIIKTKKYSDA